MTYARTAPPSRQQATASPTPRIAALAIAWALYGVALFLPALHGAGTSVVGGVLLLFGWTQAIDAQCFAWLANPVFILASLLLAFRRYRAAVACSIAAAVTGLDTFRASRFPPNEAYDVQIDVVGSAFYVWELSFLVLALAALWLATRERPAGFRDPA